jgi:transcriptional regulator with XRE-family HTH domain
MDNTLYFDTLPLHPGPLPLETFTSYLIRIANANGISHLSGLNAFFANNFRAYSFTDNPPRSFGMLPMLVTLSEDELLKTTFYHVGAKFGCVYQPRSRISFFSGLIAPSLRFCPLCLQEDLYYRLIWRFLSLQGCPKHACRLVEHCSYCGSFIPIFVSPFQIGACPVCKGDLRTSVAPRLTEEELQGAFKASQEIEFLLSPHSWETTEPAFREKLGQEFLLLRYNKQLKRNDVSIETGISMGILEAIELGQSGSNGAKLRWYFMYASYLGVPLSHIFINAIERKEEDLKIRSMPGKYFLTSEGWVIERVQEAVRQLEISGQRLTRKAIYTEAGISKSGLYKYDSVQTLLGTILFHKNSPPRVQDPLYEEQLLEKAQEAVQKLSQAGKPITHQAVSSLLGIRSSTIVLYPRVKMFLGQFVDYALQQQKHAEECEQALLEKVRTGVMDLKDQQLPVTYDAISQKIGIFSSVWLPYAQVRAFVDQHLDSPYLRSINEREQREEVLISRVEEALSQLEMDGKSVTFKSLGKLLGVNTKTLKTHPRVKSLIEQQKNPSPRGGPARRSEEEVLSDVQRIIELLTGRGASVNYAAIAREMGVITIPTLKTYSKVRMLVDEYLKSHHIYQLHQFALREEQLLCRMEAAISELEALGKPFTQRELCTMVGKCRSALKRYPRVNALLKQKVTRHHIYQRLRKQPEQEDLVQRVKEALIDLAEREEHMTLRKVARMVKISREVLMQYPQVVLLLEEGGYKKRKPRLEREEELLGLVREAIHACKASGQPITKVKLSNMVGVDSATLHNYLQVRALMTKAANEDQQQRREMFYQEREEELIRKVVNAIQQLQDAGKRISVRAVGEIVHLSHAGLHYYPKVGIILESAITAQRTPR